MGKLLDHFVEQIKDQIDPVVWEAVWPTLEKRIYTRDKKSLNPDFHRKMTNQFQYTIYGQSEIPRLAFCDFGRRLGAEYPPDLDKLLDAMLDTAHMGWWWPFERVCVLSERPSELHFDQDGRLHAETGPAIGYPDSWALYFWHGRRVPEWVVMDPTPQKIADEENTEIRRCGIESLGWENYVTMARLRLVGASPDPGNPGQEVFLYDVPEDIWGDPVRLILVTNGSPERNGTRRRYGLTVPREIRDPIQAVAWTVGESKEEYLETGRRT